MSGEICGLSFIASINIFKLVAPIIAGSCATVAFSFPSSIEVHASGAPSVPTTRI